MEIENLEIIIESDTERAVKGLQKLQRVMKKLNTVMEQSGLKKLHEQLRNVASINLSKQANALERIVNASKLLNARKIRDIAESTKELNGEGQQEGLQKLHERLRHIASLNLAKQANALERIVKASKQLNGERIRKLAEVSKSAPKPTEPAANPLEGTTEQVGRLERIKQRSRDIVKEWSRLHGHVADTEKAAKKTGKAFTAMTAIKTILMYSVLFSALNAITKGIKEGLDNVAHASKEANEVMTQYKSVTLEMKNALGAAAIPTLKLLYPLLQLVADGVIAVANAVNILTSAMTGSETYTRATKYVDDYVRALQKAKGLLGMDEINTVGQAYSYEKMFETVHLDTNSISKAAGTLFLLVEGLILFNAVKKGIAAFFKTGASGAAAWGAGFGWIAVLVALAVAELVVFALWGQEIMDWLDSFEVKTGLTFKNVRSKVEGFFDGLIPADSPFSAYMDNLTGVVNSFVDALESGCTTGIGVVRNFVGMVYSIFHGDLAGFGKYFLGYFANIGKGIADSLIIPFNVVINTFEAMINGIIKGINVLIKGINAVSGNTLKYIPEVSIGRIPTFTTTSDTDRMVAGISGSVGGAGTVKGNETTAAGLSGAIGGALNTASAEQNALLREQNALLERIAAMDPTVSVSTITRGIDRMNRRAGRAVVVDHY